MGAGRPEESETIVAVATPPGRGALGTVRISGRDARRIVVRLFRPWHAAPGFPPARRAVSGTALDGTGPPEPPGVAPPGPGPAAGTPLDHGVLVFFPADSSPTGEDLAEITLHGSPPVLARFLEGAVAAGARPALPGEFSYRAFLNGRLDAAQAEAVDDLVRARTLHQARVAHQQQTGALARAVEPVRALLVEWLARLEGSIEFSATESEEFLSRPALDAAMASAETDLASLLAGADAGMALTRGARVVLAGPVNAGKSSLFNALLGRDRAIVSPAPGTTRDFIEAEVEWDGLPVTLVDTAGARPLAGLDPVEVEGQRRGSDLLHDADLVIWLLDATAAPDAGPLSAARRPRAPEPGSGRPGSWWEPATAPALGTASETTRGAPPCLVALNKVDLLASGGLPAWVPGGSGRRSRLPAGAEKPEAVSPLRSPGPWLPVSARTGAGLDGLRRRGMALLAPGWDRTEPPLVGRLRQKLCLQEALAAVRETRHLAAGAAGEEVLVLALGRALEALARLTGRGDLEEVYDRIFATFCIGK